MRRSFLVLTLLPAVAVAQVNLLPLSIRLVNDSTVETYTFRDDQCDATISVQWIYTSGIVCSNLKLWATENSSCGDVAAANDLGYDEVSNLLVQTQKSGTFSVDISKLPGFANAPTDGGTAVRCGDLGVTKTHRICGAMTTSFQVGCFSPTAFDASPLELVYDTKPPSLPTITVSAQDGAAKVEFSNLDSDTTTVFAEYRPWDVSDAGAYVQTDPVVSTTGFVKIANLTNGVQYDVRARAVDAAGNQSDATAAQQVTPIRAIGFFGELRQDGSTEQGGCAVAGSMLMLPLAGLALARALARKSRR